MTKLTLDISMSLDGFVAGPNQTLEEPLGKGGEQLHEWVVRLEAWREPHGLEGGETNADSEVVTESDRRDGRGRSWAGGCSAAARGLGGRPQRGRLVGRRSAVPRAGVRAHASRARDRGQAGRNDVHVRHRRHRVRARAGPRGRGEKDVALAGGADVAQQYLRAGLLDELQIHVAPLLLGGGVSLFGRPRYRSGRARADTRPRVAVGDAPQVLGEARDVA